MHARKLSLVVAIIATTSLLTTACGSAKATPKPTVTSAGISIFGTDGIMSNDFGDSVKPSGLVNGLSGTAALAPLSPSFTDRLKTINPKLDNYNYAGQAYDAVVIAALAAQSGRSVDGPTIASYINGVTTTGVECDDVTACLDDIANGKDIAYQGISLTNGFTKTGEPATASFSTLHFGDDNHIDPEKTEFVTAGNPDSANNDAGPALAPIHYYSGKALTIGLLLPKTGELADEGKPILAGAELAVRDLNTAGGILGKGVQTEFKDDGGDPAKSVAGANQLIADGVPVIIGPSSSGEAEAVLPITTKNHVVLFSPSATAASLSTMKDNGLFFRTAPSDTLQAQAIADVIARSGAQRIFIVARGDTYGTGLEHDVTVELNADGIDSGSVTSAEYSAAPDADNSGTFAQIASEIGAYHADAVLLIGYKEIGGVIESMSAVNLTFNIS